MEVSWDSGDYAIWFDEEYDKLNHYWLTLWQDNGSSPEGFVGIEAPWEDTWFRNWVFV